MLCSGPPFLENWAKVWVGVVDLGEQTAECAAKLDGVRRGAVVHDIVETT